MLKLALRFELQSITRSRASLLALTAFLVVGALALLVGERYVAQWERDIASAVDAQATTVTEAREALARGARAPAGEARVDLTQAHWQDRYAANRIVREPGALAGIAAGAVDSAPAAFLVSRHAQPSSTGGYRIENPELAIGTIDLVFVLTMLMPLLIGVLGVSIGARERETGLESLIVIQAGSARAWWMARGVVVGGVAALASTTLCVAAGVLGGASAQDVLVLTLFAIVYAALWAGLLLATSARATTLHAAAFRFGMLWTLLCVLLPALAAEHAVSRVGSDFSTDETVEARDDRWAANGVPLNVQLASFGALYPDLQPLAPQEASRLSRLDRSYIRGALESETNRAMEQERLEQRRQAVALAETAAWWSPRLALTLASERLAGVGADAGIAYRQALSEAVQARVDWVSRRAWERRPLTADDFEDLVASTPATFQATPHGLRALALALLVWCAVAWGIATYSLRAPTRRT